MYLYTRNQDGTCTKQSQVVEEYFEAYWDALTYLGDERVVHVYLHEVEVLMPAHSKVWGCLIALCFGVAIGTSDPVLSNMAVCFIIVACVVLYISEGA